MSAVLGRRGIRFGGAATAGAGAVVERCRERVLLGLVGRQAASGSHRDQWHEVLGSAPRRGHRPRSVAAGTAVAGRMGTKPARRQAFVMQAGPSHRVYSWQARSVLPPRSSNRASAGQQGPVGAPPTGRRPGPSVVPCQQHAAYMTHLRMATTVLTERSGAYRRPSCRWICRDAEAGAVGPQGQAAIAAAQHRQAEIGGPPVALSGGILRALPFLGEVGRSHRRLTVTSSSDRARGRQSGRPDTVAGGGA
ncbi:hypothetical protein P3T39_005096 [Kitasatospora sp. GP82]|nr:hypothetical protein [Kitasatospora sp. GP82]